MKSRTDRAIAAYSNVSVETAVAGASPQRLIVMLYDGALAAMQAAKAAIGRDDAGARGAALSKAIAIIDEGLRPALDTEAGGEIAANLMALYEYVANRLLYANLKADEASIDEAVRLMSELRGAWDTLERQARPQTASQPARERAAQGRTDPEPAGQERAAARKAALSYGRV
jgi:flagellar protein FliS